MFATHKDTFRPERKVTETKGQGYQIRSRNLP